MDSERIEILKQPEQDTAVDIVFRVTEVGNSKNAKEVTVTVTVKAQEKPEKNVLDVITPELLFDAIKGENTSADAMTKPLVNPNGTNYIDDFYAVLNDDGITLMIFMPFSMMTARWRSGTAAESREKSAPISP